jgi:hypothetical protein
MLGTSCSVSSSAGRKPKQIAPWGGRQPTPLVCHDTYILVIQSGQKLTSISSSLESVSPDSQSSVSSSPPNTHSARVLTI